MYSIAYFGLLIVVFFLVRRINVLQKEVSYHKKQELEFSRDAVHWEMSAKEAWKKLAAARKKS